MADPLHQVEIKGEIVQGEKPETQNFVILDEVTEVSAAKALAKWVGFPRWGERSGIVFPTGIFHVNGPLWSVGGAVAGDAGWQHAVEHIDAAGDQFEQLVRLAQTHGVAGFVSRQKRCGDFDSFEHVGDRFPHGETADGIPVEIEGDKVAGRLFPQVRITPALNNPEVTLSRRTMRGDPVPRPLRPSLGQGQRFRRVVSFTGERRAFVENHADIAADGALRLENRLRGKKKRAAVEVALKPDPLFGDLAQL